MPHFRIIFASTSHLLGCKMMRESTDPLHTRKGLGAFLCFLLFLRIPIVFLQVPIAGRISLL